ncbi:MAG: helix-turn-helix domain-containing protein, partial [Lentihominibacter sp.]|nr:helix-turn-helix domain-containing protein [Lentihominibacter sp.]
YYNDQLISLTAKEFDILFLLATNPKRIYSADQLFQIIWKSGALSGDSKTVSVHISSLRKKLDVTGKEYIINIRSIGYKFNHILLEAEK